MKQHFLKLCSIVLTLVMLFNMLPHQVLADTLTTEEMKLPSNRVPSEESKLDTSTLDVIEEVTENRTEFSKEFKMSNGLHMAAVYGSAVHYDDNGTWKEIDNTLVAAVADTDAVYTNTAGVWNISFPQQLSSDNYISVTKDGYTLHFGMAGALTNNGAVVMSSTAAISATEQISSGALTVQEVQTATAQVQQIDTAAIRAEAEHPETVATKMNSRLQYSNIYPNTHVVYDLQSNMLKESVLISRYDSDLRGYRYFLDVGTMIPVLNEDNSVWFYDNTQTDVVMVMPAPYMLDAENGFSDDVEVVLENSGSTYTLLYLLPTDWLAAEDRAWPVVLDPVIAAETTPTNVRDTIVAEGAEVSYLFPTNCCGYELGWGVHRFYVKYDNLPNISAADVIVSANFRMYKEMTSTTADPVEVHKVNTTWQSEGLTWSNMPGFNEEIEDFVMSRAAGNYYWDITDIVRGWYDGENTGMMFKSPNSVETAQVRNFEEFRSSDYNYSDIPELSIYFRNNIGLESYWDYTVSSAGRAGTGYVNNYTGNMIWVHNDIGFGGNRMPVSINHIYNISESHLNLLGLGYGWRTNFNQFVYRWSENSNYYVWEDADGTVHYFLYSSYGTYKDEDGLELTLTNTGSGTTKYCITDKYGNKSYFDTYGRLTKQQNNQATPSSIEISYTTSSGYLISSITDGAGRKYSFTYSGGLLSRISYTGTGTSEVSYVTFGYTGSNLTAITAKDGQPVKYEYTGHLLTSVEDIDGYKLTYSFSSPVSTEKPHRVLTIAESDDGAAVGSLSITYDHNQTTFTDQNDNQQIIQFNNWGNTIAIQDGEGHAQYAQYATDLNPSTGKSNQLKVASKLQNTVANLLQDNSFELGTAAWTATGANVSNAAGTAYFGSKALKVDTNSLGGAKTTFTAEAGKTYTFSAYVKTGGSAAYLTLGGKACDHLAASSDWTRLEVSYTNSTSSNQTVYAQVMNAGGGTTYVDCVQVEVAPTASRYNLIVNGDFQDATVWSTSGATGSFDAADTAAAPQLSTNAYKLTGTYSSTNRISQTVNVSGNAGDTFILAGWAKGNAAPYTPFTGTNYVCSDRKFGLVAVFNHTDGTTSTEITASFNPDVDNWQYVAVPIVAEKAYSSVTVYLAYDHNANDVYFDGIQLFKERFGNSYTYDPNTGNLVSVVDLQAQNTTYQYDSNSNLTKMLQGNVSKMTYTYDNYHNVLTATDANGTKYTFTYDAYGNNTSVSTTSGGVTMTATATYSGDGNLLVSTTDAAGATTHYGYNADTNVLEWVKYPNNTDATKTTYSYDSMYRVATASASTGDVILSAQYEYDDDYLTKITTGSTTYGFDYGNFGLRSSVKVGTIELAHYTYESGTNYLKTLDYGNGDSVQYTYDDVGRLTKETYNGGANVTYAYDNDGGLATVTDSATGIKTTYFYDFVDRLESYNQKIGDNTILKLEYGYDLENRLTTETWYFPGSNAYVNSYTYNADGTVQGMGSGVMGTGYSYDGLGRLTRIDSEIDKSVREYTYRDLGNGKTTSQVTQLSYPNLLGNSTFDYSYDTGGNITSYATGYTDNEGNRITDSTSYHYDKQNQLTRANMLSAGKTWTWTYDDAGNITKRTQYAYTTGNLGTAQSSVSYGYTNSDWGDLLTSYGGNPIAYEGQTYNGSSVTGTPRSGNPISYYNGTRWTFDWDNGRELTTASKTGTSVNYTYDADGMRKTKTVNGELHTYYYSEGKLLREIYGDTILDFFYNANGTPIAMRHGYVSNNNYTIYYYITNLQGDVIRLVDHLGQTAAYYRYDPYGKVIEASGSHANINPLRYRGYYYDVDTELYYLQSRYYDPQVGRFINADTVLYWKSYLGMNLFCYCNNSPVIYADFTGYGKTYVIYYDNPGSDFEDQAYHSPYYDEEDEDVIIIAVTSNSEFIDAWNSLEGEIDYVYLYLHGGTGVLYFHNEMLGFEGDQSFADLQEKNVNYRVYLFSCFGGAGEEENNVAFMFSKLTSAKTYACTGSVSYSRIFDDYYARKAFDFGIIKTFFYQQQFIFWGKDIAVSLPGQW